MSTEFVSERVIGEWTIRRYKTTESGLNCLIGKDCSGIQIGRSYWVIERSAA